MSNDRPEFFGPQPQDDVGWNRPPVADQNSQQWGPEEPAQYPQYPQHPVWNPQQTSWQTPPGQYEQPFYGNQTPYGPSAPYSQQGPYQQGTPHGPQNPYRGGHHVPNPYEPGPYASFDAPFIARPRPSVGLAMAVRLFFKNYAVFNGRASRSEYWWVQLAFGLAYLLWIALMVVAQGFASLAALANPYSTGMPIGGFSSAAVLLILLGVLGYLAVVVPSLAITWRRFHDTDKSGAFYLLSFVPWVGGILVMILLALPSVPTAWQRWDTGVLPAES